MGRWVFLLMFVKWHQVYICHKWFIFTIFSPSFNSKLCCHIVKLRLLINLCTLFPRRYINWHFGQWPHYFLNLSNFNGEKKNEVILVVELHVMLCMSFSKLLAFPPKTVPIFYFLLLHWHVFIVFFFLFFFFSSCRRDHAAARCSQDGIIRENVCAAYFSQGLSLANYCPDGSQRFSPITCIPPLRLMHGRRPSPLFALSVECHLWEWPYRWLSREVAQTGARLIHSEE